MGGKINIKNILKKLDLSLKAWYNIKIVKIWVWRSCERATLGGRDRKFKSSHSEQIKP